MDVMKCEPKKDIRKNSFSDYTGMFSGQQLNVTTHICDESSSKSPQMIPVEANFRDEERLFRYLLNTTTLDDFAAAAKNKTPNSNGFKV